MPKFFRLSLHHSASCLMVSEAPASLLLLFSSCLTLVLSSPPCPLLNLSFYLNLSGRSGRNSLLLFYQATMGSRSSDIHFSRGTTRLMSWPDSERCSCPPQSLVVSLLLSLVSTPLFSRTGSVQSHSNSWTLRFPRFPPRNLCSFDTLAVFFLVFAATHIAYC